MAQRIQETQRCKYPGFSVSLFRRLWKSSLGLLFLPEKATGDGQPTDNTADEVLAMARLVFQWDGPPSLYHDVWTVTTGGTDSEADLLTNGMISKVFEQ
jgi:hypothetical protein